MLTPLLLLLCCFPVGTAPHEDESVLASDLPDKWNWCDMDDGNVPDESALAGRKRFEGDLSAEAVSFEGEFDRIYCGAPDWLTIEDPQAGRAIGIEKHGLPDAVVWNPHVDKAQRMGDFGDDEWPRMLCVEPAAVERAVELAPGKAWTGQQVLHVMPIDAKRTGFP